MWGFIFSKTAIMAYKLSNFLANVDKIAQQAEEKQKKEAIGLVINSLQRPFKEVLNAVIVDQTKQVEALIKSVGWKSSN
jgi:hypothetical protein